MTNTTPNFTDLLEKEIQRLNKTESFLLSIADEYKTNGPPHALAFSCTVKIQNKGKEIHKFTGGNLSNEICRTKGESRNVASGYAYTAIKNREHPIWKALRAKHGESPSSLKFVAKQMQPQSSPEFHPQFYESPIDLSLRKFGKLSVYIDNTNGEEMTGTAFTQSLVEKKKIYYHPDNRFGIENRTCPNLKSDNNFVLSGVIIVMYKYDNDLSLFIDLRERGNDIYIHLMADNVSLALVNIADNVVKKSMQ
jgi:hypothetical protein